MSPIDLMSPGQRAAFLAALQSWRAEALSTKPVDRRAAERAIRQLYKLHGADQPVIVWVRNPVEAMAQSSRNADAGPLLAEPITKQVLGIVEEATATHRQALDLLCDANALKRLRWDQVEALAAMQVGDQPGSSVRSGFVLRHIEGRLRHRLLDAHRVASPLWFPAGPFLMGAGDPLLPAAIDIIVGVFGLTAVEAALPFRDLARSAGYTLPRHDVCWICERPSVIGVDEAGELHAQHGPALDWGGTLPIYVWHGIEVPAHVVAPVETMTARGIRREGNLAHRDIMIERVGIEWYVRRSGAVVEHEDETGRLWVTTNPLRRRRWCAVEVKNGTPEPDGSVRRYFLRVPHRTIRARQGVAWTYGLTEEAYRIAVRT